MAPLSRIDDRLLWLGFGLFFFIAAKGVQYAIKDVVRLIEIDDQTEPIVGEGHYPENDISLDNLKTLAESPNPNIANAAISLIVQRFLRDDVASKSVLDDIQQQSDPELSKRAKQAFSFIRDTASTSSRSRPYWWPPSMSNSSSSSLVALEDRHFPGVDGWVDTPPLSGLVDSIEEVIVPSEDNAVAGWNSVPRERSSEEDGGEMERRWQRREAMVIRLDDGGVEEGDIIRPNLDN